jgi:hypothetical protein
VKREKHCHTPPVTSSSNIVVQIHGQIINIDDSNMTSLGAYVSHLQVQESQTERNGKSTVLAVHQEK